MPVGSRAESGRRVATGASRRRPHRQSPRVGILPAVCGLLGLLTSGAEAATRTAAGRRRAALRSGTAARTRAAPGTTPTWCSGSTGCRSSTSSTRTSRCAGTAGAGPLHDRLQRRDLQLPGAARRAGPRARRDVRHRGRHRGDRRRLPPLGPGRGAPAARHVRLPDLGRPGAGAVRRARPVRHQAAVHWPPGRGGVAFASEKKSLLELAPRWAWPAPATSTRPRCSTTCCCSTCRSRPRCTAAIRRIESRHALHRAARAARSSTERYFTPGASRPAGGRRARRLLRADRRRAARLGGQAHARRRHGRRVPVRRHRLDRDRGAGQASTTRT